MTTESTATTSAANLTAAADLKSGDRIHHLGTIREVRHVEPFSVKGQDRCFVLLDAGGFVDTEADSPFAVATAEELAEAHHADRRQVVAKALRELARTIVNEKLPMPRYHVSVGGCVDSRADAERWAEHLGVEIQMIGDIPVAERALGIGEGLKLAFHFQGPSWETKPEPAADEDREAREDFQTMGADEDREPLTVETSEDSAAIVDANLRAMGAAGLSAPGLARRSLIGEVRDRGLWPGQVRIGPDLDFGQAARA